MIESANKQSTQYVKSLLESMLYYLCDKKPIPFSSKGLNQQRFIQLRELIEKFYKEEKFVHFYAKKMGLSSKRLNEIIKEVSQKGAIISVQAIVKFNIKKEKLEEFLKIMESLKVDLVKVEGCLSINIFQNSDEKEIITVLEYWESIQKHQEHIKTVVDSGGWEFISSLLTKPPLSSYTKEL